MSKSLKRVIAALEAAGIKPEVLETGEETRTAEQAAAAAGCELDQIVKSILFQGETTGDLFLFLTAGGNRVDAMAAARLTGEPMGRADGVLVRQVTGFAIGGVAPVGHLNALPAWADPRLMEFDRVWAAAGTPRHIFPVEPQVLLRISGARLANFAGAGNCAHVK